MTMLRSFSALLLVGALAGGCDDSEGDGGGSGGSGGDDRASVILGLDGDAAAGAMVFTGASGCSNDACHGADGTSGMAMPSLDVSVPMADDAQIVTTFLEGRGSMPAFAQLSDQELADLLAYVSDTFG